MTAYFPQRVFDPRRLRSADRALFVVGVQRKSLPLTYPPFELEPQMRGVLTILAPKCPSAGLGGGSRSPERNQEKKLPDGRRRWTKSKEDYPLLRATRTGRQDSAATPHEATHS